MKKIILLLLYLMVYNIIFSQDLEIYLINQNVETLASSVQDKVNNPVYLYDLSDFPGITGTKERFNLNDNEGDINTGSDDFFSMFNLDAEVGWSKTSKYLRLPVSYFYKNFELNASLPFYLQRQVYYSHGYVSAYGLGDLAVSGSWKYQKQEIFNKVILTASLPTGNHNKSVDGFLCPLGTGSYDFIFANKFQLNKPTYSINSVFSYIYSGKSSREVIIKYPNPSQTEYIDYDLGTGNTFVFNASYNRYITNFLSIFGGFSMMHNATGKLSKTQTFSWKDDIVKTEGDAPFQKIFIADVKLAAAVTVFETDLVFVLSQPVYTWQLNPDISKKRKLLYYIKLSKNIF